MTGRHLAAVVDDQAADPAWLRDAVRQVARDPAAVAALFPAVGRRCGRGPLADPGPERAGWTVDDAARVLLLAALPLRGQALADRVGALYRDGGAAEKRAVLRALPGLDLGAGAVELLHDALRTNDARLIAAAVGPYARHLDDRMWRQAVLKCVFMGIPLTAVADLDRRADDELAAMLADLDDERRAAGRTMPDDAIALLALIGDPAPPRPGGPAQEVRPGEPTYETRPGGPARESRPGASERGSRPGASERGSRPGASERGSRPGASEQEKEEAV